MKSKLLLIICSPALALNFMFTACGGTNDNEQIHNPCDSINSVSAGQDSVIQNFLTTFNEIGNSLDSISRYQANVINISERNKENIKGSTRENINYNIAMINKAMAENNEKIKDLNKKLKSSVKKGSLLEKTIQTLEKQLLYKQHELLVMSDRLAGKADSIVMLQSSVDAQTLIASLQADRIMDQSKELHRAYYIIGTKKELEKMKVINSEGGILGLGKTQKIAPEINKADCTEIDYFVSTTIYISTKDAKILTTHPSDSYTMDKGEKESIIQITNPQQFWSISKFLVIEK
jgi:hypothetical protein